MITIKNVRYGLLDAQTFDAYLPDNNGFDTIVWFHGGGLSSGDKADYHTPFVAEQFVSNGYGFISVNYTLYPEAKFPSYLVEAAKAVAYIKEYIGQVGGNGEVIVSGQSAGAWISMMLCFDKHYLRDEGLDPIEVKAWIPESGQATNHFNIQEIEDKIDPWIQRIDERAPIYFVDNKTTLSKMLLILYDQDMPMRYEQNMLLYKTVLHFNPQANIETVLLNGQHCKGSCCPDEDGIYPFVKETVKFLKK